MGKSNYVLTASNYIKNNTARGFFKDRIKMHDKGLPHLLMKN